MVITRGQGAGFSGIEIPLFYVGNTRIHYRVGAKHGFGAYSWRQASLNSRGSRWIYFNLGDP
jgi:hypothetical protein